jgi:sialate O-acetylesterase
VREGDNCEIHANQAGKAELVIRDILFGDVWVCSGQSNMEWPMGLTFNSTQEITEMASFKKIR